MKTINRLIKIHKEFENEKPLLKLIGIDCFFQLKLSKKKYLLVSSDYNFTNRLINHYEIIENFFYEIAKYSNEMINIIPWSILKEKAINKISCKKYGSALSIVFSYSEGMEIFSFFS